ncbi:MAG TPA: hypothetical protein VJ881_10245 [Halanaerobiales bacterium]|nr:hypothetical protein [Halanaerobiales bacterium]
MKSISKVALRILAIYFLVEFLSSGFPQLFGIFRMGQSIGYMMTTTIILSQLIKLLAALYLWFAADKISNYLVNKKEEKLEKIDYQKLQIIAYSVVAIVLLIITIPELLKYLLMSFSSRGGVMPVMMRELAPVGFKVIIALWLLLDTKRITKKLE